MRKNTYKASRVNEEVKRALSVIIQNELKDPRVHPLTSVTACDVTRDLKYCKVFVSVMADEESRAATMEGLLKATPFIRHALAESVNLRITPELRFIFDDSIENGIYMSNLIAKVREHDEEIIRERGDEEETEETELIPDEDPLA